MEVIAYAQQRELMVNQQIAGRGITDLNVLNAMNTVPRHLFVPQHIVTQAYDDCPLPIGFQQTISQPYIVALMTESLQLKKHHRVLEIGSGCGYQTAVLAEIAAQVYTIEIVPELAQRAAKSLQTLGYQNVHFKCGDGLSDWAEQAPFDRIIVTAAPSSLPMPLLKQLKISGSMIIPFGTFSQNLYRIVRNSENTIEQQILAPVRFVAMTGKVEHENG
ncbi:MAG: protein-L-isoaspartate(D-aspartate) O-methyltransferase [Psychromonas sp.]